MCRCVAAPRNRVHITHPGCHECGAKQTDPPPQDPVVAAERRGRVVGMEEAAAILESMRVPNSDMPSVHEKNRALYYAIERIRAAINAPRTP